MPPKINRTYSPGDLVFAKVKGYPPWPARIEKDFPEGYKPTPGRYSVFFYGTYEPSVVPAKDIYPYLQYKHLFGAKRKMTNFNRGLDEIENNPNIGMNSEDDLVKISQNNDNSKEGNSDCASPNSESELSDENVKLYKKNGNKNGKKKRLQSSHESNQSSEEEDSRSSDEEIKKPSKKSKIKKETKRKEKKRFYESGNSSDSEKFESDNENNNQSDSDSDRVEKKKKFKRLKTVSGSESEEEEQKSNGSDSDSEQKRKNFEEEEESNESSREAKKFEDEDVIKLKQKLKDEKLAQKLQEKMLEKERRKREKLEQKRLEKLKKLEAKKSEPSEPNTPEIRSVKDALVEIDQNIKVSLQKTNANLDKCLEAIESIGTVEITQVGMAKEYGNELKELIQTLRKCRKYKPDERVRQKADHYFNKLKEYCTFTDKQTNDARTAEEEAQPIESGDAQAEEDESQPEAKQSPNSDSNCSTAST